MDFESLRKILYDVCTQAKSNEGPHTVAPSVFANKSYGFGRATDNYPTNLSTNLTLQTGEVIKVSNYGVIINYALQFGAEVLPVSDTVPQVGKPLDDDYRHPNEIKDNLTALYAKMQRIEATNCRTQCLGSCKSSCLNSCLSECATSCSRTCAANCTTSCKSSCKNGCYSSCTGSCNTACSSSCVGSCTGSCYTSCSGACYTGCAGCRGSK